MTTVIHGNAYAGCAVESAASADETVRTLLVPVMNPTKSIDMVIADPGNGGEIPAVTGCVSPVSTGVETRTLAAPTKLGTELLLSMTGDGGNITVTSAESVTGVTNNKTMTFDLESDSIILVCVAKNGGGLEWQFLLGGGVAFSAQRTFWWTRSPCCG